jgi:hypothetical protein
MKLEDIKKEIQQYQYLEDTNIINVSLASIIATRLKLGDPIWLIIIGPSSGGKSQILRPLALTDEKFLHRLDDLTENTFLSASHNDEASLLTRIGPAGMLVMSDLTVLFSKNAEARNAILSQFRMIYDGEMVKHSGNKAKAISWKGYLGVIAGSTPSIYRHFEDVADMGERFVYYRMKEYDAEKATRLSMHRKYFGKELDSKLSDLYADYIKKVVKSHDGEAVELSDAVQERILKIALFAERIRTPVHMNWKGDEIDRIPVSAMPMRVALQLTSIAKALLVIRRFEGGTELLEEDIIAIEWCGYSLANEEKRSCLRALAKIDFDVNMSSLIVGDIIGLSTNTSNMILQNLAAVGVLKKTKQSGSNLVWKFINREDWETIRRVERIETTSIHEERFASFEETDEIARNF